MTPAGSMDGKVTLITGGGAGIGLASAQLFAQAGAIVACADISADAAIAAAGSIECAGGRALAITADVAVAADIERMVAETLQAFGRIDVLFNNAGFGIAGKVHELSEDDWDRVMTTNVKSMFLASKAVLPHFLAQGHGSIVNTASSLGILALPSYAAYCTSKAAIIMLTKAMALDYGPAIRVNCICPGAVDTPRIRGMFAASNDAVASRTQLEQLNRVMGRLADPVEVAQAALFLASDAASFCTGVAFVVDGGQTIDA
jgi:NAD(P)-dependent dehydrogenase (short-subunit alcohol dehydrogenase family)